MAADREEHEFQRIKGWKAATTCAESIFSVFEQEIDAHILAAEDVTETRVNLEPVLLKMKPRTWQEAGGRNRVLKELLVLACRKYHEAGYRARYEEPSTVIIRWELTKEELAAAPRI